LQFCHGASSLSRGRVCHVIGHSSCLCQAIYTYVHFELFLFCILYTDVHIRATPFSPGYVLQIMPKSCILSQVITTSYTLGGRTPDRRQVYAFYIYGKQNILIISYTSKMTQPLSYNQF